MYVVWLRWLGDEGTSRRERTEKDRSLAYIGKSLWIPWLVVQIRACCLQTRVERCSMVRRDARVWDGQRVLEWKKGKKKKENITWPARWLLSLSLWTATAAMRLGASRVYPVLYKEQQLLMQLQWPMSPLTNSTWSPARPTRSCMRRKSAIFFGMVREI